MRQGAVIKNFEFSNWAGSYKCKPECYFEPADEHELKEILLEAKNGNKIVRVVGNGHSPSDICCTDDYMISIKRMNKVIEINEEELWIKVEGGIMVSDLIDKLQEHDMALDVVPSVPDFTLAGMISTASHNTGLTSHVTTGYVIEFDLMLANGQIITCSKKQNSDGYFGGAAGIGALGVILRITLQCTEFYGLRVFNESLNFDQVLDNLQEIAESSLYTRIFYIPLIDKLIVQRVDKVSMKVPSKLSILKRVCNWIVDELIGYRLFQFLLYFSIKCGNKFLQQINYLYYKLFYSRSFIKIDNYRNIFTVEVKIKQYVMEWAIPIEKTKAAMSQLKREISKSNFPAHSPCEIRFVKGDQFWLSPAFGRDSAFINILAFRPFGAEPGHQLYLSTFGRIMESLGGRPHLAKNHEWTRNKMTAGFPRFEDFCHLKERLDPDGRFSNSYINRICLR